MTQLSTLHGRRPRADRTEYPNLTLRLKRPGRFAPRQPRTAVRLEAALLLSDDRVLPITIENISPDGALARCGAQLPASSWVGIDLPNYGIVRAQVRWTGEGELGCRFRTSIDIERLEEPPLARRSLFASAPAAAS